MGSKRKKTDRHKALTAAREYTNVTCELSRIRKNPDLFAEIRDTCLALKQIQLEAWHIANLHVLRCLEDDIKLPSLDMTFFGWCCQGARTTGIRIVKAIAETNVNVDQQRKPARSVNEDLRETVCLYRQERERVKNYISPPQLEYDGNIMLEIANQMRVNAENMVVLHFKKRLYMYARLSLDEKNKDKVPASKISRLVQACYRSEDSAFEQGEIDLYNLEHFVLKLYGILTKVKASQQKDPNKKDIRSFSLLSYSSTYSAAHIVINGSTLHGFCARIYKKTGGQNPLDIPLTASGKVLISPAEVCKSMELFLHRSFAVSQFETMAPNVAISKREFDEMSHETKSLFTNHLFANQITTNSYSASVLLSRPRPTSKTNKKKLRTQQTKTEEAFDEEWRFLLNDYKANALVAIDPGMWSLCTVVSEGMKTKKKKTTHGGRPSRQVGAETVHSINTEEYRHVAGMNKARFWYENLKKRKKRYAKATDVTCT